MELENPNQQRLFELVGKFPDSKYVPRFDAARPFLYNMFVIESGPACMLITHYYFTGRPLNDNEKVLRDPGEIASYCIQNLPYCSKAVKRIRQVRNKLAHNDPLTTTLFKETILSLIEFSKKSSQISWLMESFLAQLILVCSTMLTVDNNEAVEPCVTCPLCRSLLPKSINSGQMDLLLTVNTITNSPDKQHENFTILDADTLKEARTLLQLRNSEYREKLKGARIKVLEGKWANCEGIFRCWSGTVAYVEIKNEGRKALRVEISILILQ